MIEFLKDVWATAMIMRLDTPVYSVAENIKDWERFMIVEKRKKIETGEEHKEKTQKWKIILKKRWNSLPRS